MKKGFIRAEDGTIHAQGAVKWVKNYQVAVEEYLTLWEDLFQRARDVDEFQFILALLRFKGDAGPGWDTFDNTINAFEESMKAARKFRGRRGLSNTILWLYGHIVEASDHYEIIANMVNIAGGEPYRAYNFPKIKNRRGGAREQYPNEKIIEIRKRCKRLNLKDYSQPFTEVLDKDLRNAVYHSDYSIYSGAVRFRNVDGYEVEYDAESINKRINQAMTLHETIKNLLTGYTASYKEPKIIDVGLNFSPDKSMKAQVIVRKKYGVMALQQEPSGSSGFALGIYRPGELERIKKGQYLLPRSRVDQLNHLLNYMPSSLARRVTTLYEAIQGRAHPS